MEKRINTLLVCLFLFVGTVLAQIKVTGTVVSQEDGEPVIGASVMVEGAKTGTITDLYGKFSLPVPQGKKIVVSFVGMLSQTLRATPGMKVVLVIEQQQADFIRRH